MPAHAPSLQSDYATSMLRINCGGTANFTDVDTGLVWVADANYLFGNIASSDVNISGAGSLNEMYRCNRWSGMSPVEVTNMYNITLVPGYYDVILYFANLYEGTSTVGTRVYDVYLNNALVISSFDAIAASGATMTAYSAVSSRVSCTRPRQCTRVRAGFHVR